MDNAKNVSRWGFIDDEKKKRGKKRNLEKMYCTRNEYEVYQVQISTKNQTRKFIHIEKKII